MMLKLILKILSLYFEDTIFCPETFKQLKLEKIVEGFYGNYSIRIDSNKQSVLMMLSYLIILFSHMILLKEVFPFC